MSHIRKQIRDAVAAQLSALGGVHVARVHPIREAELPVFLVYTGAERDRGQGFNALERAVEIIVELAWLATDTTLDDTLDALLVQVEQALPASLGGAITFLLTDIEQPTLTAGGAQPVGRARIRFEAQYRTPIADPEHTIP